MIDFIKSINTELILALIVMIQGYLHNRLEKRVKVLEEEKYRE